MLVETVIILYVERFASVTLHTCTSFNTNIYVKGKNTSNQIKKYHTDRTTPKSNRQNRRKSQNRHPLHTYKWLFTSPHPLHTYKWLFTSPHPLHTYEWLFTSPHPLHTNKWLFTSLDWNWRFNKNWIYTFFIRLVSWAHISPLSEMIRLYKILTTCKWKANSHIDPRKQRI